jgi:hypothetical protein
MQTMQTTLNTQAMPQIGTEFVDESLRITIPWYRLLISMWQRTGSQVVGTMIYYLQLVGTTLEAVNSITGDVIVIPNAGDITALEARVAILEGEVAVLQGQVAALEGEVAELQGASDLPWQIRIPRRDSTNSNPTQLIANAYSLAGRH